MTINFRGAGRAAGAHRVRRRDAGLEDSYRLMLDPKDRRPRRKLQGWAIVENQTDNDWDNVQLTLVSGRPISFIQDLYQPLYVPRPVVQPELYASLRPQTYDAGLDGSVQAVGALAAAAERAEARLPMDERGQGRGRRRPAPPARGAGRRLRTRRAAKDKAAELRRAGRWTPPPPSPSVASAGEGRRAVPVHRRQRQPAAAEVAR